MPKCYLEFDLETEESELKMALNGTKWALVSWDIDQLLRQYLKYGHEFKSANDAIETIREELHSIIEKYNLTLNDIE